MRIETVRTSAFAMDYVRFGQGEEPLVIIPGLSVRSVLVSADAIARAYRPLADDFAIYVFDRRKDVPASYSVYDMAQDTQVALRALGLDRVCLFGASQGGMIAMTIAIEWPELVRSLVVGSTSACVTEERFRLLANWIDLAKNGNVAELYLEFGKALYPPKTFEMLRGLLLEDAKTVTDADLSRFIVLAEGLQGFDVSDSLERISCPMLVIGSKDDQVLGAKASQEIAKHFEGRSDFELFLYDDYGHAAYDLAPDYKERMLRFLK